MTNVKEKLHETFAGAVTLLTLMFFCSIPELLNQVGRGSTPLPELKDISLAEVTLLVFASAFVGQINFHLSQFLPRLIWPTRIVRRDWAADVLSSEAVRAAMAPVGAAQEVCHTPLVTKHALIQRWLPDIGVYRIEKVTYKTARGYLAACRKWEERTATNRRVLEALMTSLDSKLGARIRTADGELRDNYDGAGAARVGMLIAAILSMARILLFRADTSWGHAEVASALVVVLTTTAVPVLTRRRATFLQERVDKLVRTLPHAIERENREPRIPERVPNTIGSSGTAEGKTQNSVMGASRADRTALPVGDSRKHREQRTTDLVIRAGVRVIKGSYTTGAAVAVISRDSSILLVRKKTGWALPGGFFSRDEEPSEAANREVWEETGLRIQVSPDSLIVLMDQRYQHIHFLYRINSVEQPLDLASRSNTFLSKLARRFDVLDARRFSIDSLPVLSPGTSNQLRVLGVLPSLPDADQNIQFLILRSVSGPDFERLIG